MIYKVVCVRDRSAVVFGVPMFVNSIGSALRSFGDEINRADKDNMFYKHPEDFDLFELGLFDDSTGKFEVSEPRQLAVGKDLVRS